MGQKWSAVKERYTLAYAEYSVCGRRPEMEDAFLADLTFGKSKEITKSETGALFGVFDGHSGDRCSAFAAKNLPSILLHNEKYPSDPETALTEAFLAVDKKFLARAKNKSYRDGSTAIVALILNDRLFAANAGDSRGVLCHNGKAIPLSSDHKPDIPEEKARIEKRGGKVLPDPVSGIPRVNGKLAVSRSFGDLPFKDTDTLDEKYVTARPDITTVPITSDTAFMILACDGFWDTVSNDDAVHFVLERLKMRRKEGASVNLYEICVELTTLAYNNGSDDNISIVLVAFEHLV